MHADLYRGPEPSEELKNLSDAIMTKFSGFTVLEDAEKYNRASPDELRPFSCSEWPKKGKL